MKKTAEILDDPVIQIENLVKEYKSSDGTIIRAVNNVSMSVAPGEIVGLLGANGAGKTTTLRIIATLLQPTSVMHRSATTTVSPTPLECGSRWDMYQPQLVYLIV